MQLKKLLQTGEDRAVSPVIGVILMVAITVILAAVIASFVLGLGDSQEVAPTATFDFDYDTSGANNLLTVTHTGGDNIIATNLYARGSLGGSDNTGDWPSAGAGGSTSATIDGQNAVTSGDSVELGGTTSVPTDYVARMVWESSEGTTSSELATDRGPDA